MMSRIVIFCLLSSASAVVRAEDGYDLWLRYRGDIAAAHAVSSLVPASGSPTLDAAADELRRGLGGLMGRELPMSSAVTAPGALIIGTPRSQPALASLPLGLERVGD